MKKIVLSIAGVLAATAFAPEASAIPAFARQTGMACNACHQQHYPVLNGFGAAFKAAGYTMMGAQEKVEGEHLSIPASLNAAILLKARYQKTNGVDAPGTISGTTTNSGQWQIPDEMSLFFGGRIAENIGFMMENNIAYGGPTNAMGVLTPGDLGLGGIVAGFKMPIVFDLGSAKILAIPFLTDALGVAYGYDESSTGMVRGIRWMEHRSEISAMQYIGNGAGAATGVAVVAKADMGYINVTKFAPDFAAAAGATSPQFKSTFVRIAATPTMGDWAMHIGAAFNSGSSYIGAAWGGVTTLVETRATSFDFQAQGQVGGKDLSVYATHATAPVAGVTPSVYRAGAKAWTIGADYSVIPHTLHLGAAYRNATTAAGLADDATSVAAIYDLTQNVALHVNYSAYSGGARAAAAGNSLTTFMLEAAW